MFNNSICMCCKNEPLNIWWILNALLKYNIQYINFNNVFLSRTDGWLCRYSKLSTNKIWHKNLVKGIMLNTLSHCPLAWYNSFSKSYLLQLLSRRSASSKRPSWIARTATLASSSWYLLASLKAFAPLAWPMLPKQTEATSSLRDFTHIFAMFSQTDSLCKEIVVR